MKDTTEANPANPADQGGNHHDGSTIAAIAHQTAAVFDDQENAAHVYIHGLLPDILVCIQNGRCTGFAGYTGVVDGGFTNRVGL